MTRLEYETIKQKIEGTYHSDLAALDRIWALFAGGAEHPASETVSLEPKRRTVKSKLSRSEGMKASWARRRAGKLAGDERGLSQKSFNKFLVKGPTSVGGNGD